MSVASLIFIAVIVAAGLAAIALRRIRRSGEGAGDPGEVLMQFGEVFPGAAIRDVVRTADGKATFLRLADGRTGLVRSVGGRYEMMVLQPSATRVDAPAGENALTINPGDGKADRPFVFSRPEDAAEVSLWLCTALAVAESDMKAKQQDSLS